MAELASVFWPPALQRIAHTTAFENLQRNEADMAKIGKTRQEILSALFFFIEGLLIMCVLHKFISLNVVHDCIQQCVALQIFKTLKQTFSVHRICLKIDMH